MLLVERGDFVVALTALGLRSVIPAIDSSKELEHVPLWQPRPGLVFPASRTDGRAVRDFKIWASCSYRSCDCGRWPALSPLVLVQPKHPDGMIELPTSSAPSR